MQQLNANLCTLYVKVDWHRMLDTSGPVEGTHFIILSLFFRCENSLTSLEGKGGVNLKINESRTKPNGLEKEPRNNLKGSIRRNTVKAEVNE